MHKQSLFHISKRDALPWYQRVLIRGGAILLALIVCALVTMLLTGENPISIYGTILRRVRHREKIVGHVPEPRRSARHFPRRHTGV